MRMRRMTIYRIICVLIAAAVILISPRGFAQIDFESFKKPIPEFEPLPEDVFKEKTQRFEEIPLKDKSLAYAVRLPNDWTKAHTTGGKDMSFLSNRLFNEIGRFYAPVTPAAARARFTVDAIDLDYKMTAEQWLLKHLIDTGVSIQGMDIHNDYKAEAIYVEIERNSSYVVRALALLNGKKIILARLYLPIEKWEQGKAAQAQVIESFTLLNEEKTRVETLKPYRFLDIAEIEYPQSWKLLTETDTVADHLTAQLLHYAPKTEDEHVRHLDGEMQFHLILTDVTDTLEAEIKKVKKTLGEKGLAVGEPVKVELEADFHDLFEFGHVEAFKAAATEKRLIDYEYWIMVGLAGEYYYIVTLLTPARTQDYFLWSRNTQSYKTVLEHIRPLDE